MGHEEIRFVTCNVGDDSFPGQRKGHADQSSWFLLARKHEQTETVTCVDVISTRPALFNSSAHHGC